MTDLVLSRRNLIKVGAAAAAGAGAAAALGAAPAQAAATVSWPLMADGFTTNIDFHQRLHSSHQFSAYHVNQGTQDRFLWSARRK
jgi:hypothetical protein